MDLALAALPGVITTCLLVWALKVVLDRQNDERKAHRTEVAAAARALGEMAQAQRAELASLAASYSADLAAVHATHREQTQALIEIHRREVATLCQRIQAPQVAVAQHMPQDLPSDPHQPDIEDDLALLNDRKRELDRLEAELQIRAEELATEPFGSDLIDRDPVNVP